jgi:hypothetical protein
LDTPCDSAPAALADLIAAGLVSHEMIGDPLRLGGEAAALKVLCGLVSGPVWRIEPFHYAFRAEGAGDAEARAATLEAALAAALGPEAVWVNPTEPAAATAPEAALLLLRAQGEAALEAAGPEILAVVNARFAAAAARLAAGAEGPLAERLAAFEARQAAILAAIEARNEAPDDEAGLAAAIGGLLQRLDEQAAVLAAHVAREDMVAGRLAELAAIAGAPAAFQETLGVTLAEFLAQLERRAEAAAPTRVPHFS